MILILYTSTSKNGLFVRPPSVMQLPVVDQKRRHICIFVLLSEFCTEGGREEEEEEEEEGKCSI